MRLLWASSRGKLKLKPTGSDVGMTIRAPSVPFWTRGNDSISDLYVTTRGVKTGCEVQGVQVQFTPSPQP